MLNKIPYHPPPKYLEEPIERKEAQLEGMILLSDAKNSCIFLGTVHLTLKTAKLLKFQDSEPTKQVVRPANS